MKVRDTSRGRMYAVSSAIGCTVINGDMAVDIPAGGQSVILALDKKLIIDGYDDAKFVEVRWGTNAAVGGRPREPEVTTTNIPISFLESTGTQYIKTDYIPDNETGGIVKGLHPNFFTGDNMVAGMRNDTTDTRWCISGIDRRVLSGWGPLIGFNLPVKDHSLFIGTTNWKNDRKCSISYPNLGLTEVKTLGELPFTPISVLGICGMLRADGNIYPWAGRLFSVSLSQGEEVVRNFIPTLAPTGTPCLYETISDQNFYNAGVGAFVAGFDTAEQAGKLATLPDVTAETDAAKKSLTVSFPLELAFDAGVQSALSIATSRGWTIVVQYRESELTTDHIEADFLESTATQWIDTKYIPNNETGIYLQQLKTTAGDYITGSYIPIGCRNDNSTQTRFFALRSMVDVDFNFTQGAGFGWGSWVDYPVIGGLSKTYTNYMNDRVVVGENEDPIAIEALPFTPTRSLFMFAARVGNIAQHLWGGRIYEAEITQGEDVAMSFVPRLDPDGVPCMYDTVSGQNFYNANTAAGTAPFIVGFETTEKAAVSLSKLPVTTGDTLTVSLPAEAEDTSTLVPAAIDIAKSRGWTIITQYRTI